KPRRPANFGAFMTSTPTPSASVPPVCASCGSPLTGRFCARCGAAAEGRACASCQASLSPGARFCHRCGTAVLAAAATSSRERTAWIVAAASIVVALLLVVWKIGGARPQVPDMANAGNIDEGRGTGGVVRAPDISSMSPRERFDRLYDRVIQAAEAGDSQTVVRFAPMALGAYDMLDTLNADARYHSAMIHLTLGDFPGALALADTIQTGAPGHLFVDIIRGEVADRQNDTNLLARSYRDFLDHYDQELKTGRVEYQEHRPILEDFRTRAKASLPR
ncbi:MAG TPA: zinc ribbon domain-containing protein, partial [Gemmatimonadales bacterium]|nr:zinc ribbon domain-containing protein [Gemmatimonadales bacterium]